jgi:hypothetical protein
MSVDSRWLQKYAKKRTEIQQLYSSYTAVISDHGSRDLRDALDEVFHLVPGEAERCNDRAGVHSSRVVLRDISYELRLR